MCSLLWWTWQCKDEATKTLAPKMKASNPIKKMHTTSTCNKWWLNKMLPCRLPFGLPNSDYAWVYPPQQFQRETCSFFRSTCTLNSLGPACIGLSAFFLFPGADVVGLLETDAAKPFLGNYDMAMYLSEVLGMYTDYGPGPRHHTWG